MTPDSASNVYQQMEVTTADNLRLVVLLYDGAIRFLTEAKGFIQTRDLVGKAQAIDRASAILGELQSTLSVEEGGEIAASLDRLYLYMMDRVLEASSRLDVGPLDEVVRLLRLLNSAWTEIAQKAHNPSTSMPESTVSPLMPSSPGQGHSTQHPLQMLA